MLRAVVFVAVAAAAVCVMGNSIGPIPSLVYRKETFAAASGCTGTVLKVEAGPVNYCLYAGLNSTMVVIGPGGNLTQLSWVAGFSGVTGRSAMCTGPYTSLSGDGELTTASGACVGGNVKYTYPISDAGAQWGTQTVYTDGNCNTPNSGPVSFQLNTCLPDGNGNSVTYTLGAAGTNQWIKTAWTGSTTCSPASSGADQTAYGNVCLPPPPSGSYSFQYTSATPFSSTAGTVNPSSSTGTNGGASVLHAASPLSAGVAAVGAAVAAAVAIAAL